LGYSCTDVAPDGIEAVQMSAVKAYDIILMDVNMPLQDGLESSRQYSHVVNDYSLKNSRKREEIGHSEVVHLW